MYAYAYIYEMHIFSKENLLFIIARSFYSMCFLFASPDYEMKLLITTIEIYQTRSGQRLQGSKRVTLDKRSKCEHPDS